MSLRLPVKNLISSIACISLVAAPRIMRASLPKNLIEGWARIPTEVEVASEFRYCNPIITPTYLGGCCFSVRETADTLAAIRDARIKGAKVFGITNDGVPRLLVERSG